MDPGFVGTSGEMIWNFGTDRHFAGYHAQHMNIKLFAECDSGHGSMFGETYVTFDLVLPPSTPPSTDPAINHRPYFKPQSREANLKSYVDTSVTVAPGATVKFLHSKATDQDGDAVAYTVLSAPPGSSYGATTGAELPGVSFDTDYNPRMFTWNVPAGLANTTYKIRFRASDGKSAPSNSYDERVLTINVKNYGIRQNTGDTKGPAETSGLFFLSRGD